MKVNLQGAKVSWDGWYESGQLWYIHTGGDKDIISNAAFLKELINNGWTQSERGNKRVKVAERYSVDSKQVRPPQGVASKKDTQGYKRTITISTLTRDYVKDCLSNYELYSRWCFLSGKEPLSREDFLDETNKIITI